MTRVIPLTGVSDEEWLAMRHPFLGASEIPILSGDGYSGSTYWSLWREKRLAYAPRKDEVDDRMWFGKMMQPVYGNWLRMRKGWDVQPSKALLVDDATRTSCSMDFWCSDPASGREMIALETKQRDWLIFNERYNVEKNECWIYDKIQLASQMRLSKCEHGCVAVFVGGNEMHTFEYTREQLNDIIEGIPDQAAEFWRRVDQEDEPALEYSDMRQWSLDRGPVDPELETALLNDELDEVCTTYNTNKVLEKDAKKKKEQAQATLVQAMAKHGKAISKTHMVTMSPTLIAESTSVRKEHWRNNLTVKPRPATAMDPLQVATGPQLSVLDAG